MHEFQLRSGLGIDLCCNSNGKAQSCISYITFSAFIPLWISLFIYFLKFISKLDEYYVKLSRWMAVEIIANHKNVCLKYIRIAIVLIKWPLFIHFHQYRNTETRNHFLFSLRWIFLDCLTCDICCCCWCYNCCFRTCFDRVVLNLYLWLAKMNENEKDILLCFCVQ